MTEAERKQLEITACKVRMGVIEGVYNAKSGHPGGSLSASDLFTYLYFKEMNVNPEDPHMDSRDRFVLSKGHTAPGLYATLALKGFFPVEELKTLRHIGSRLQGHPDMNTVPGIDMSTGSLGQGISAAVRHGAGRPSCAGDGLPGLRPAGRRRDPGGPGLGGRRCLPRHRKLDNLVVIVDNNGLQIDGTVGEVMRPYPIRREVRVPSAWQSSRSTATTLIRSTPPSPWPRA